MKTSARVCLLLNSLPELDITAIEAANRLHMSEQTLRRHLLQEGTTFRTIKDSVRENRLFCMISGSVKPAKCYASELGFSQSGTFTRWFQNRTGQSFQEFRRET